MRKETISRLLENLILTRQMQQLLSGEAWESLSHLQLLIPNDLYAGQQPIKPVSSGNSPTAPHQVCQ